MPRTPHRPSQHQNRLYAIVSIAIVLIFAVIIFIQLNPQFIPSARINSDDTPQDLQSGTDSQPSPADACLAKNQESVCFQYSYSAQSNTCQAAPVVPCCTNNICESEETINSCPQDCAVEGLEGTTEANVIQVRYHPELNHFSQAAQVFTIAQPVTLTQVDLFINYALGSGDASLEIKQGVPFQPLETIEQITLRINELNRQQWHTFPINRQIVLEPGTYHILISQNNTNSILGLGYFPNALPTPDNYQKAYYQLPYITQDQQSGTLNWQTLDKPLGVRLTLLPATIPQ